MNELVLVFEDWRMDIKEGTYYIDDITFLTQDDKKPTFAEIIKKTKKKDDGTASDNSDKSGVTHRIIETDEEEKTAAIEEIQKEKDVKVEMKENESIEITLENIKFKVGRA